MSINIEEEVIFIDALGPLVENQTLVQMLASNIHHTDSGVVNVFRVVVTENLADLNSHAALYERLLHSALSIRVIIRCVTGNRPAMQAMESGVIPESILNAGDRVRMLIIEDNIGVYFGADRGTPEALAIWPDDPDGVRTLEIIDDALKMPEVFNAVFEKTKDAPFRAFSVGTRQAWFGRFPVDAISDVFKDVGLTITGGDSFSALERRPPEWQETPHLCGNASESDLLIDGEGLSKVYKDTQNSVTHALRWFGLKSGYSIPKRIARFKSAQLTAVSDLSQGLRFVDQTVGTLIGQIEASDGFSDEEATRIEKAGIRLYRDDDERSRYKNERTTLLENVLKTILLALSNEQSISPYFGRLDDTISKIEPRTSDKIREDFQEKLLTPATERLDDAEKSAPSGPAMRIAQKAATLFAERWFQILMASIGFFGLLGVLDHIFDERSPDLIKNLPLMSNFRGELRLFAEVLFLLFILSILGAVILFSYADAEIKKWGRSLGFLNVKKSVDDHEAFIRSVALNDWILSKTRRSAIEPLVLLRDAVLREVVDGLSSVLTGEGAGQIAVYDNHSFNPSVRRTFQAGAHIGIFKNLPQVKKVLSIDVVSIVRRPIESHGYSLLGSNASAVGPRIVSEVREQLSRYVQSVFRFGVYSQNHMIDGTEGERERQRLMEEYWSDSDSINELLHGVVLTKESEPIVQFIQAESLSHLDAASERTVFIRFAPKTAKLEELVNSTDQRESLNEVEFTKSAEIGGVIRLIGYREGTIF